MGRGGGWGCGAGGDLAIAMPRQWRVLAAWPRATEARQHSLEISAEPEMMNGGKRLECVCV